MDEDNAFERCLKWRPVLGNITNQLSNKRPRSSVLGNGSLKSVGKGRENLGGRLVLVDDGGGNAKHFCVGPRPCNKISSSNVDVISGISSTAIFQSTTFRDNNGNSDARVSAIEVVNDMDGLVTGVPVPARALSGTEDHDATPSCEINDDAISSEGTESDVDVLPNGPDEQGLDNLVMSQSGSVDFARLPESQESRVKVDTCVGTQTCEDNSSLSANIDSIKACSCTFCTKATYIWLDLHHQDSKGRIAAIKKSQREASILVEGSCRGKGIFQEGPEKNIEATNLESSLNGQWKSLFQHMEHIFRGEADQLEGSLVALTYLKERCKAELDTFDETPGKC